MANLRKLKQSTRAGPGRVKKGAPEARARKSANKTPPKRAATVPPAAPARISSGSRRVPAPGSRVSARIAARVPALSGSRKGRARSSQAESMADARATHHASGISQGGQTGNKRKGGTSPSRGRRGGRPTKTRR
jgi:hypothetical protein